MRNIFSSYRRKQVNISKAIYNDAVNFLMNKHYTKLYSELVRSRQDQETFNDTFLKLTYNYNPEQDFMEQFKYYFRLLKGAYYRDDKIADYYLTFTDIPDVPDIEVEYKDKISIDDLRKEYANFKKTKERTNKAD